MFGDLLPLSVGAALSPMPIAALVLILLSNKAKTNSVFFLMGWMIGLALMVLIVATVIGGADQAAGGGGSPLIRSIQAILGIGLIIFAMRQWKERTHTGQVRKTPKWMASIELFSPFKSFGVGLLLSTVNLKNTPIGMSVGVDLIKYPESDRMIGLLFYVLIASSTILVPVVSYLLFGNKLQHYFELLKTWLIEHNAAMMFVLFLLLGVIMLSRALRGI